MEFRRLGATGLDVAAICLGTAMFGFPDFGCDEPTAEAIFTAYRNAGGNFLDTANAYGAGASEEIVGRLLRGCRDEFVVATKVGQRTGSGPNDGGLSRVNVLNAVHESLRRLQTDYIDLYQIHSIDPWTPIEETLEALDVCVRAGWVRYIGCSNIEGWRLASALATSRERGLARFASAQLRYSLVAREIEREVLPACEAEGLGVLCFNPLAAGLLTGKVGRDGPPPDSRLALSARYAGAVNERTLPIVECLVEVAASVDATPAQLGLAWALARPGITSVISGARKVEQIVDNLGATGLVVPEDALRRLDEVSNERLGYPYELLLEIEEMHMRVAGGNPDPPWPSAWRGQTWR